MNRETQLLQTIVIYILGLYINIIQFLYFIINTLIKKRKQ